jgi:hypothetical protein
MNDRAIEATWLSRSCSRSSRHSNRPGRRSGLHSSCRGDCRSSRRSSCRSNRRSSPVRSNSSRSNSSSSISSMSTKSSPPSSSRSLPLSCICKIAGSGETSVVTFVAAFAEAEEAAVEVVEIVTRGELRAWTVVSRPYS